MKAKVNHDINDDNLTKMMMMMMTMTIKLMMMNKIEKGEK